MKVGNYLVFSLGGIRPFNTQSKHHHGRSLSSSVPSRSVIFFLQGPPCVPSVIIDGGETVENSKAGSTAALWLSAASSTSILEWDLMDTSLPDEISPLTNACAPGLFLLGIQCANRPRSVSWARLIYKFAWKQRIIKQSKIIPDQP